MAMRTIIGDLSADNARGPGGFGAGVYWGVGVQHIVTNARQSILYSPHNILGFNLLFYFSNLSLTSLTRLIYITTP